MGNVLPYVFRSNSFALREVLTDMLPGVHDGPLLLTRIHHMPHEQEGVGGALTDAV